MKHRSRASRLRVQGRRRRLAALTLAATAMPMGVAWAQSLPIPCGGASCGPTGPTSWITQGSASASLVGPDLHIYQQTDTAIFNWQSFNIGAGNRVEFEQPSSAAVALNRIFQQDPSRIFGALEANGRVYLLNQNGILFGEGSRVDVGAAM
jgi:filamentous hemagglutinin family protein